ncbi:MAG: TolC family protein [Acidobacteriota bacterium]
MEYRRDAMSYGYRYFLVVSSSVLTLAHGFAAEAQKPQPGQLTLRQALEEAFDRSPVLRAQRAQVGQAQGRFLTARTYRFNPQLSLDAARRRGGLESVTDRGVTLAQEIEIGGQRRQRVRLAGAEQDAARARFLRTARLLAARVRGAFVQALGAGERVEVDRANADLAASLADVARKRFEAGAAPQMEVNLALVQVGRSQRDVLLSEGAYQVARTMLAEVVGLDADEPPVPVGKLDLPGRELPAFSELLASALKQRADLQTFRHAVRAAQARLDLARREVVPNLMAGAFYAREEGTDRLLGAFIGARIPIFNRNRGAIAEAQGLLQQAEADAEAVELQVRQEVASTLARYRAAAGATTNLQAQVLGSLQENLGLLRRSFEAGKTSWTEVLVFRREFVEVRREYLETLTEALLADIEMDLAIGMAPPVSLSGESRP